MKTGVYLELGAKRVFACTLDWPVWCRSGKDEDLALAALADYKPRYGRVPEVAGIPFDVGPPPSSLSSSGFPVRRPPTLALPPPCPSGTAGR